MIGWDQTEKRLFTHDNYRPNSKVCGCVKILISLSPPKCQSMYDYRALAKLLIKRSIVPKNNLLFSETCTKLHFSCGFENQAEKMEVEFLMSFLNHRIWVSGDQT